MFFCFFYDLNLRSPTALHLAVRAGCLKVVYALISAGGNVNQMAVLSTMVIRYSHVPESYMQNAVHIAAAAGHKEIFDLCLSQPNVDPYQPCTFINKYAKTKHTCNLLHLAAVGGNISIAGKCLQLGIPPANDLDGLGWSPLHFAIAYGNPEMVQFLLENTDVDPNALVSGINCKYLREYNVIGTPLLIAMIRCPEVVPLLLNAGADAEYRTETGIGPLHLIADEDCRPENYFKSTVQGELPIFEKNLDLLLERGADINGMLPNGLSPLTIAMEVPCPLSTIERFLKAGSLLTYDQTYSRAFRSPWQFLFNDWRISADLIEDAIDLFRKYGADLFYRDIQGNSLLHATATPCGFVGFWRISRSSRFPDQAEACKAQGKKVELLLKAGADACAKNESGITPLRSALVHYNLLNANASPIEQQGFIKVLLPLVKAGDYCWDEFAKKEESWPGLEQALASVWEKAPEELPQMVKLFEPRVRAKIPTILLVLHRYAPTLDSAVSIRIIQDSLAE